MNPFDLVKIGAGALIVAGAYFFGLHQGQNSEQLKSARTQISELTTTVKNYETQYKNQALALAEMRAAESLSRNEFDRMRNKLATIERLSKTNSDRERNRCLGLAIRYKEVVDRADRAIRFCLQNHK